MSRVQFGVPGCCAWCGASAKVVRTRKAVLGRFTFVEQCVDVKICSRRQVHTKIKRVIVRAGLERQYYGGRPSANERYFEGRAA